MSRAELKKAVTVRTTRPDDIPQIVELSDRIYPNAGWKPEQLQKHLQVFPQGQLVAEDTRNGRIVGSASSLIILWDDYDVTLSYKDFTDNGYFTNHDPEHGQTLYGAEVMVDPQLQGGGIGKKIYSARRELCKSLGLRRIRAGARLRHYHQYADRMSPEEYVMRIVDGEIGDPTLSFQIKQGFRVLAVVRSYLPSDPESLGHAAVIEWINHDVARRRDYAHRDPHFLPRRYREKMSRDKGESPGG